MAVTRLSQLPDASALNGASYTVRKNRTLGDIFGDANEAGLTTGSSSSADIIYKGWS